MKSLLPARADRRVGVAVDRLTPIDQLPELLRVPEVAIWADASDGVVREAIRHGQLAHVRLGRLIRVPKVGLTAWLTGRNGSKS